MPRPNRSIVVSNKKTGYLSKRGLVFSWAVLAAAACGQNTEAEGEPRELDERISFISKSSGSLGDSDYCSQGTFLCDVGEGDCDANECVEGLHCAVDNGPRFGFSPTTDACVPGHCTNGIMDETEEGTDCGPVCGSCTRPATLVSGSPDFCSEAFPCALGEGDCDADVQCEGELVCGDNNGPVFGLPRGYDACEPPKPTLPLGHRDFCSQEDFVCEAGQGDCDGDEECQEGLVCGTDNGPRFGFSPTTDACVADHCTNNEQDEGETGIDCGGECGACSRPESLPPGSPDFCSAAFPCSLGQGDCDADTQCEGELVCGDNNGPAFGLPRGYDACELPISESATFRVVFQAMWTASSHPTDYPSNAHFSPLTGATHRAGVHLWMASQIASPGIETMAETGASGPLQAEIAVLMDAGDALSLVRGSGIGTGTGSASDVFTTTTEFPWLSVTSMIAPSPDWFVGVNSVSLQKPDGSWVDEVTIDLFAYDAGSDSGATFTSPDSDTMPKEGISRLRGGDFEVRFGTLTITRQAPE